MSPERDIQGKVEKIMLPETFYDPKRIHSKTKGHLIINLNLFKCLSITNNVQDQIRFNWEYRLTLDYGRSEPFCQRRKLSRILGGKKNYELIADEFFDKPVYMWRDPNILILEQYVRHIRDKIDVKYNEQD